VVDQVRILHAADIHLGSQLRGLDRYTEAEMTARLRTATNSAFENLVATAIQLDVDALILAGDIYDGEQKDYAVGRFFAREMSKLHDANIPVFMIAGNHDAASVVTKTVKVPDNVKILSTSEPQTVSDGHRGLAIHGQGFAEKAVTDNLSLNYPEPLSGLVNIGVLHTSVAGSPDHDPYAPCTVAELQSKGYEYFALGHIHMRGILAAGAQTVAFSGNLQGRHVKETGPKGAVLVTLPLGGIAKSEFIELDVARWEHLVVNVDTAASLDDVLALVEEAVRVVREAAGNKLLVLRVTLTGSSAAAYQMTDPERLRHNIASVAAPFDATLERVRNQTGVPITPQSLSDQDMRDLNAAIARTDLSDEALNEAFRKIDTETATTRRALKLKEDDGMTREEIVAQAQQRLIARLEGGSK
jgi:exonuclease SbcD